MKKHFLIATLLASLVSAIVLTPDARAEAHKELPPDPPWMDRSGNHFTPSALDILQNADSLTIYALDPKLTPPEGQPSFFNWQIHGKSEVNDAIDRQSVRNGINASVKGRGPLYICFEPRHGVLAKKGRQELALVICFECGQARVYLDGKAQNGLLFSRDGMAELSAVFAKFNIEPPPCGCVNDEPK